MLGRPTRQKSEEVGGKTDGGWGGTTTLWLFNGACQRGKYVYSPFPTTAWSDPVHDPLCVINHIGGGCKHM